jgi:hypothetical protein
MRDYHFTEMDHFKLVTPSYLVFMPKLMTMEKVLYEEKSCSLHAQM